MNKLPINEYDTADAGDDMQLRVRYQHSYGVILFCAASNKKIDCVSLWFEQREDILLEKSDGKFSYYQVKTRESTLGKWTLTDDALKKSIKRFVSFEKDFGESSSKYVFVSNCPFKESTTSKDENAIYKSPINFLRFIGTAKVYSELKGACKSRFDELAKYVGCNEDILLVVLKKIDLVVGPPLENFEIDISARHLRELELLKNTDLAVVNRIRDELIQKIYDASSLKIDDPYKHVFGYLGKSGSDPRVLSKRISLEEFEKFVNHRPSDVFAYYRNSADIEIGAAKGNLSRLKKKLERAGLGSQFESIKRRSLSAEEYFLEEAAKNPEGLSSMLDQIEGTVLTVCSDSILDATEGKINGVEAFKNAKKSLINISINNPAKVCSKNSECLIGVAGLLTGECKLWWTEEFDIEAEL
ncbi:MAG: hypothetical protein COB04_12560 [Gammaproteobacteria bacterium]|nr:MAG: hypothetical protein COB04_12560 [Gammaproteobacteria bacterium]